MYCFVFLHNRMAIHVADCLCCKLAAAATDEATAREDAC